jgi:hypothetical protein
MGKEEPERRCSIGRIYIDVARSVTTAMKNPERSRRCRRVICNGEKVIISKYVRFISNYTLFSNNM